MGDVTISAFLKVAPAVYARVAAGRAVVERALGRYDLD